jgi:2,3,4,5-tetrahydropyridine-2,6-dicarboxylate N-succinyltransferase
MTQTEQTQQAAAGLAEVITDAWGRPESHKEPAVRDAILETIARLDRGEVRLANKIDGQWQVNQWVQHAINLFFRVPQMEVLKSGPFEWHDKLPLKKDLAKQGIRAVAGAVVRYGSHLEPGTVCMPGFVNIGAYLGTGSLVDTWATVGSGAQIGRNVHIAGGVGVGGVLEPPGARPNIVEDGVFLGSRCVLVEGILVEEGAILGAHVSLTGSTHIIDVTGKEPVTYKGRVPARAIVIPGTRRREFPAGEYQVSCALIVGYRSERVEMKVALMQAARDFDIGV